MPLMLYHFIPSNSGFIQMGIIFFPPSLVGGSKERREILNLGKKTSKKKKVFKIHN